MTILTITFRKCEYTEFRESSHIHGLLLCMLEEIGEKTNTSDFINSIYAAVNIDGFYIYVAEFDGEIVGIAGFVIGNNFTDYSTKVATEQFLYIVPRFRGKFFAKFLKYIEGNIPADCIDFGISNNKLLTFMLRFGYNTKKTIIRKVL